MMKWMTIAALSGVGGFAGWNFGQRFVSAQAGLWLSLVGGMIGVAAGYLLVPRD